MDKRNGLNAEVRAMSAEFFLSAFLPEPLISASLSPAFRRNFYALMPSCSA